MRQTMTDYLTSEQAVALPLVRSRRAALKSFRTEFGLSQRELADALGVVQSTISSWERGATIAPHWLDLWYLGYRTTHVKHAGKNADNGQEIKGY